MGKWIILLSVVIAAGCDKVGGSGVIINMPSAQISCDSAKCAGEVGARDAYVVLSRSGCDPSQINYEPIVATGFVSVTCGGSGCSGTVTSWSDDNGDLLTEVESRSYYVCGWIDIDGNTAKDPADDAYSEEYRTVTESTLTLSDWSVTY
jgi:hypothetical protein